MRPFAIHRRERGQGWLALVLVITFFIILPLGLLGFDLVRYYYASEQMRACVDAAALAGVGALASGDQSNAAAAQESAVIDAWRTFQGNSIFGLSLDSAPNPVLTNKINATKPISLPIGDAALYADVLDQNRGSVSLGDQNGKVLRLTGYFGYRPVFAQYLGLQDLLLVSSSDAAVPNLDLELCFDISGSMDDSTYVFVVNRRWNGSRIIWDIRSSDKHLYNLLSPVPQGTRVNVLPPQNLQRVGYGDVTNKWYWSEKNWNPNAYHATYSKNLRVPATALTEAGQPPGNYCPSDPTRVNGPPPPPDTNQVYNGQTRFDDPTGSITDVDTKQFTDIVVRIDGRTSGAFISTSVSFAGQTYVFPTVASLVEASRGNLDSVGVFSSSLCNTAPGGTFGPIGAAYPKYKAAYEYAVQNRLFVTGPETGQKLYSPIGWSRDASLAFCDLMKTNTNVHFGFLAFSDAAGAPEDGNPGYWPPAGPSPFSNLDQDYLKGGSSVFDVPKVSLDQSNDNYTTTKSKISELRPLGSTNIADSLKSAINDLIDKTKYRKGSKKAIILFTDGVPNLPGGSAAAETAARSEAYRARDNRIPIYCIGLATNPAIVPLEKALLDDAPGSNGIADITKAKFFLVTNSTSLNEAFRVIARQLVQLTVER